MIVIHIKNRTEKIELVSIKIDNKEFNFINQAAKLVAQWNSKDQNKLKRFIDMLDADKTIFNIDS